MKKSFRRRHFAKFIISSLLIGLAACLPVATPTPEPPTGTPTPIPATETPTVTPVWFPATATFTVAPIETAVIPPTEDVRPQFGELIFEDQFDEGTMWSLRKGTAGSAALGKAELTIAIHAERGYLESKRQQPVLSDFYAEVTASPSMCRDEDEYGMLIRAASAQDFYRFSLACNGSARLDRILRGIPSSPQPPVPNWAIPPGAPSSSRLGVYAKGKEMQFFANGELLFTVNDPSLPSGKLGLFARAATDSPVTVNFSDLRVYKLN